MKLPVLSARQLLKILAKIREQKGSHIHLRHPTLPPLTIPNHAAIARGTLKEIMRVAAVSREDLQK